MASKKANVEESPVTGQPSTGVSVKSNGEVSKYAALSEWQAFQSSAVAEAIAANCDQGFDPSMLTQVKIPAAGMTSWEIEELEGPTPYKTIDGIVVYLGRQGVLWPDEENSAEGTQPVLRTDDMKVAYRIGQDLGDIDPAVLEKFRIPGTQGYDWAGLTGGNYPESPYGWGSSKKSKKGKRSKESRVMAILRKGDVFPLIVRASPGSLKAINSFFGRLTIAGLPFYRAVVSLGLLSTKNEEGTKFSQIVPTLIGRLDEAGGKAVRSLYTELIASSMHKVEIKPDTEPGADDSE